MPGVNSTNSTFPGVYLRAETTRGGPPRPSRPRALQRSVAISACGALAPLRANRVNALPRTPYAHIGVLRLVCMGVECAPMASTGRIQIYLYKSQVLLHYTYVNNIYTVVYVRTLR